MNARAQRLRSIGQSLWLDTIDRGFLERGELARRVEEEGISGVTTNPTIFEKAVRTSSAYDATIASLARQGLASPAIAERLMIEDVARAADALRPVFDASGGRDGFVSLEVRPSLARDAEGTFAEATRLFALLRRPNAMIKIPGTRVGWEAIRRSIAEGVNVNATLLFSRRHHEGVAKAYVEGLAERVRRGRDLRGIASVASVFVSRIDTAVDAALSDPALQGRAAVANAKAIYRAFRAFFAGEAFGVLAARGAAVQRVLWGSTGTKNPRYPDTKYVDELVGPDTVNTVPLPTLEAFLDHGSAESVLEKGLDEAHALLDRIAACGVDLDAVCERLQDEGVEAFARSYDSLLAAVEERRGALSSRA
ncbi:MAG TPA: transaldolase [Planctomycetota bacterium]|jgi:transaldolase|nr:transaldolase [Planctomycetota bacterium]